jgi:ABC-2 type transport system ATP-binding protein
LTDIKHLNMYALETKKIVKQYANHLALDGVDLQIPENKVYGLLGPNGAGKTTLIRIINRITAPDSGTVSWNGRPMEPADIYNIGYLPEERGLYKKMKVGEQALYLARLKGLSKHDATIRLNYWFDKFEISAWKNKKLEELSKGMQQKVQFIITILHEPKLLIFDEPFSGFDPVNAQMLKEEILNLKNHGATVVFSTHNMASVEEICDDITLINRSKVVLQGEVSAIRNQFSKGIFIVTTAFGNTTELPGTIYDTVSSEVINNSLRLTVKKKEGVSTGQLLRELSTQYDIRSFNEDIPTMNDIFIQTVQS